MLKQKLLEWIKRYIPLEIFSYIIIIFAILITQLLSEDIVLSAVVGTYAGYIGYFFLAFVREVISSYRERKENDEKYRFNNLIKDVKNLLIEFAPAITIRILILSPFIGLTQKIIADEYTAQLIANILSDLVFYIIAIAMYEIRKKYLDKEKSNHNQDNNSSNS